MNLIAGDAEGMILGSLAATLVFVPCALLTSEFVRSRKSQEAKDEFRIIDFLSRSLKEIRSPTKVNLLSKQQHGGIGIGLSMLVGGLGPWILTSPPENGYYYGWTGVLFYGLCCILPHLGFAIVAQYFRRHTVGWSILDSVSERMGRTVNGLVTLITIIIMFLSYVSDFIGFDQGSLALVPDLSLGGRVGNMATLCLVAMLYSLVGGFRASLLTDIMQSFVIIGVTVGVIITATTSHSGLSPETLQIIGQWTSDGVLSGVVMNVSVIMVTFAQQTFWLKFYAAKDTKQYLIATFTCCSLYFPVVVVMGYAGIVARGLEMDGLIESISQNGGASTCLFKICVYYGSEAWARALLCLAVFCCLSSVDSRILAVSNMMCPFLEKKELNLNYAKVITVLLSFVGLTVAALQPTSVLQVLYMGNLISLITTETVLLLIWPRMNKWGGLISITSAFLTVQIYGWALARDFVEGFKWWQMPEELNGYPTGGWAGWHALGTYLLTVFTGFLGGYIGTLLQEAFGKPKQLSPQSSLMSESSYSKAERSDSMYGTHCKRRQ